MNQESNLWYFEDVNFHKLFCPVKSKGMDESHFSDYKKGEFIYFPEDPSSHVYLIREGRVKIGTYTDEGKENIKAILQAGELFGEMALYGEQQRIDFAQAMDNVALCPLTVEDMQGLMKDNKELIFQITRLVGFRLRKAERRIESLMFKDARTRIIEYLVDQGQERGQKVGFETLVKHFITHKDIARLTATSRQTVTTVLNDLRQRNLINFDRKRLLIRDLKQLKEEA